jgi:hypothetical protein
LIDLPIESRIAKLETKLSRRETDFHEPTVWSDFKLQVVDVLREAKAMGTRYAREYTIAGEQVCGSVLSLYF